MAQPLAPAPYNWLTNPLLVTTTCTAPDIASGGVRIFTCVGLM
jgi:hypothetical protein